MTKQVKIYHNPRCSKSRETLNLLKETAWSQKWCSTLRHPPMRQRCAIC
ncbi:putative glutaredoxin [Escherichia coli]|uniref:Putative glutaredoxin n=1 Tax=Escherichia coli TaxID=562 RepID=A0A376REU6_ECOLX|nr:putative glutaredoxin [Escherichia coli]